MQELILSDCLEDREVPDWRLTNSVWILAYNQGKCNKELMIQIEWRRIWYLFFTYQSKIVSEDA